MVTMRYTYRIGTRVYALSTHLVSEPFLATFHKLGLHILPKRSSKRRYRSCKVRKDSWRHIQDISVGSHENTQFNTKDAFLTGGHLVSTWVASLVSRAVVTRAVEISSLNADPDHTSRAAVEKWVAGVARVQYKLNPQAAGVADIQRQMPFQRETQILGRHVIMR